MTSRLSSRNEIAADEITAFAAGAGPPENTNPTRLMWSPLRLIGGEPYYIVTLAARAAIWDAGEMTAIPPLRAVVGARIVDARELDRAPRALVHFGQSPDGLPWLCDV